MQRSASVLIAVVLGWSLVPGLAHAGLIHWSYSSERVVQDGVYLEGRPTVHETVESGSPQSFRPELGYNSVYFNPYNPFPPGHPITVGPLVQRLTITDDASGQSKRLDVPFKFVFPTAPDEPDYIIGWIDGFRRQQFVLGRNSYTIEEAPRLPFEEPEDFLVMTVAPAAPAPEPATLLLATLGVGGAWLARCRWFNIAE
jgi:hypothetical protein